MSLFCNHVMSKVYYTYLTGLKDKGGLSHAFILIYAILIHKSDIMYCVLCHNCL